MGWGFAAARHYAFRGPCCGVSCCCRATRTPDQQHNSSPGWGFAALAAGHAGCCCGGSCCCRATRTPDQQHNSSPGWGFAPLASAPFGVSCCGGCCCYAKAGTAEGRAHKKTTTQQHNKRAASLGWGFAAARHYAFRGAAAVDPAAAGLLEHRTNNTTALRGGASLRSPLAFRGLLLLPGYRNSEPLPGYRNSEPLPGYPNRGPLPGYRISAPLPGCFRFSSVRFRFHLPPPPGSLLIITPDYDLLKNVYYVNK